jgi:importin-5
LGVLFTLSISQDVGQREIAYRIFSTTPGIIEKQHEDTVLSAFTKGFKDDDVTVWSSFYMAPKYAELIL